MPRGDREASEVSHVNERNLGLGLPSDQHLLDVSDVGDGDESGDIGGGGDFGDIDDADDVNERNLGVGLPCDQLNIASVILPCDQHRHKFPP